MADVVAVQVQRNDDGSTGCKRSVLQETSVKYRSHPSAISLPGFPRSVRELTADLPP